MNQDVVILLMVSGLCLWAMCFWLGRLFRQPENAGRYPQLDGLRGILAWAVIAHHSYYNYTWREGGAWGAPHLTIVNLGAVAVSLFFMLSAYFHLHKIRHSPHINWREFYMGRAKRIYPLYCAVFAVVVAITLCFRPFDASDLARFSLQWLLFQNASYQGFQSHLIIAGVQWTLVYEWAVYTILPLFHMLYHRKFTWQIVAWLAMAFSVWAMVFHTQTRFLWLFVLATPAVVFAKMFQKILQAAPKYVMFLILMIFTVYIFTATAAYSWTQRLCLALLFAFIANGFSYGHLLKQNGLIKIGEWSYAIYLLHGLVLFMWFGVWKMFAFGRGDFGQYVAHLPLIFSGSVLLAFAANRHIEQRFWHRK